MGQSCCVWFSSLVTHVLRGKSKIRQPGNRIHDHRLRNRCLVWRVSISPWPHIRLNGWSQISCTHHVLSLSVSSTILYIITFNYMTLSKVDSHLLWSSIRPRNIHGLSWAQAHFPTCFVSLAPVTWEPKRKEAKIQQVRLRRQLRSRE